MRNRLFLVAGFFIIIIAMVLLTRGRALPLAIHTLHADDSNLQQIRDLGATSVVQVFSWSEIEPTRGEYHWEYTDWLMRAAQYYHLRIIARLDQAPRWAANATGALDTPPTNLDDYGDFVAQVAARYRGQIAAYIIWNEPNLAREWGKQPPDPAAYVALLKTASARLRAIDPNARIVSAGLAPTNDRNASAMDDRAFLRAMYAASARGAFDILGTHPYSFANPPDDPHGAQGGLNFLRIQDLRDIMVANGDAAKPIWITEFGYPTETPPASAYLRVSEEDQANWLVRAYEIAREQLPYVGLFTVWNLTRESPAIDQQAGYSLLHADGTLKPAYNRVRAMNKESPAASVATSVSSLFAQSTAQSSFSILARDAIVHLGDSEYPLPWVPLYLTKNPSTTWTGEFYLTAADLQTQDAPWQLTMELMQVNDFDTRVLVNDLPVEPPDLPTEDFTSIWVSAQFQVPENTLRVGRNTVTLLDGKLYPAFQQPGYTWDDFQVRNVMMKRPEGF